MAARIRGRHREVHDALARGMTIIDISRTLSLDRKTVRRYATATTAGELKPDAPVTRAGLLDPHLPYLHQRWADGVRSTERLHQELRARGYAGSLRTLRRVTARLRQATAVSPPPAAPAAKKVARWILTPPGNLTTADRVLARPFVRRHEKVALAQLW